MRVRAAILDHSGLATPYAESLPISIRDVDLGEPREGDLLIKIMAAGVCHSDLSVVNGSRPRPLPMVLGHEASGIVVGRGSCVKDVSLGDHVVLVFVSKCGTCAYCIEGRPALCEQAAASNAAGALRAGGSRLSLEGSELRHHLGVSAFSEYAVVDQASAVVIDSDVPFDLAAMFGCALITGVGAVINAAGIRQGESVGIWGIGGVGLSAVMGAVASGASEVIAVDPVPEKRKLALSVGASMALDITDNIRDYVADGVDIGLEAVGNESSLRSAYDGTKRGGRTISVGLPGPSVSLTVPAVSLVVESRTLIGSYLGSSDPAVLIPELLRWWRDGRLPVEKLISGYLALDDVNSGMDALNSGRVTRQIIRLHEVR